MIPSPKPTTKEYRNTNNGKLVTNEHAITGKAKRAVPRPSCTFGCIRSIRIEPIYIDKAQVNMATGKIM